MLLAILLALVAIGLWRTQPWQNGWEKLRVLFMGEEPTRSVAGDWQIGKVVVTGSKPKGMLVPRDGRAGRITFSDTGLVSMSLSMASGKVDTSGKYALKGTRLTLTGFDKNVGNYTAGSQLAARLVWADPDNVLMKVGNEQMLYLRRIEAASQPTPMILVDASKGVQR